MQSCRIPMAITLAAFVDDIIVRAALVRRRPRPGTSTPSHKINSLRLNELQSGCAGGYAGWRTTQHLVAKDVDLLRAS